MIAALVAMLVASPVDDRLAAGSHMSSLDFALDDDIQACFGDSQDACFEWDTSGTAAFQLNLTDCDGAGTDCVPCYVDTGTSTWACIDVTVSDLLTVKRSAYSIPATNTVTANAAAVDLSGGDLQAVDLQGSTGDVTVTISNPTAGQSWALKIIQGDGADDIVWSPVIHCPGGPCASSTISTTEDAVDLLTCIYDGTSHLCTLSQDIKGT